VQDLWSGLGRAADPAGVRSIGVEARSSRKHEGTGSGTVLPIAAGKRWRSRLRAGGQKPVERYNDHVIMNTL
jgi:hypothetical protein